MRKTITAALLLLLTLPAAHAQPADAAPLSEREAAWVAHLGDTFRDTPQAERIVLPWAAARPDGSSRPRGARFPGARGLRVTVGALEVHRLRCDDAAMAQEIALKSELAWCGPGLETPVVGEARGDQLVLVRSARVRDPAFARRALDAAWKGLPCAPQVDGVVVALADGETAVTGRPGAGPLAAADGRALLEARSPGVEWPMSASELLFHVDRYWGHAAAGDTGATVAIAPHPDRLEALRRYVADLTAPPPALPAATARASRGLEDALDAALGR